MFIRLYELRKKEQSEEDFCAEVLHVYEVHGINGQWKR